MLSNYILSDILKYIFNKYIDHHQDEIYIISKFVNFESNVSKYIQTKEIEKNIVNNEKNLFRFIKRKYIDENVL